MGQMDRLGVMKETVLTGKGFARTMVPGPTRASVGGGAWQEEVRGKSNFRFQGSRALFVPKTYVEITVVGARTPGPSTHTSTLVKQAMRRREMLMAQKVTVNQFPVDSVNPIHSFLARNDCFVCLTQAAVER